MRGSVDRIVTREQCGPPCFEPGAFWEHDELSSGQLLAKSSYHGFVAGHASDQQHAPQRAPALIEERNYFAGHAVVQRGQDVSGRSLVAIELMRHVGLAMHGAA